MKNKIEAIFDEWLFGNIKDNPFTKMLRATIEDLPRVPQVKMTANCPKCGDEVLGDEDGLCSKCV